MQPGCSPWLLCASLILAVGGRLPLARADDRALPLAMAAAAQERPAAQHPAAQPRASSSLAVGRPNQGRLEEGVPLESSDALKLKLGSELSRHGTAELVRAIDNAARRVADRHPGSVLLVGDLSRPTGRRHRPHRSHQSGLDADIGFFLVDENGDDVPVPRFVALRQNGCGEHQGMRVCLDAPRTWDLIAALMAEPTAPIQFVLIAPALGDLVLAAAEAAGAPAELRARAATLMAPHRGSREHRSHFHLRIYCPVDDRPACRDQAPFHAWYLGEPPSPAVLAEDLRESRRRHVRQSRRQRLSRAARVRAQRRPRAQRGVASRNGSPVRAARESAFAPRSDVSGGGRDG